MAKLCLFRVLAKHHNMLRACLAASLCHLMGCSLPGPSVHGIVPAEILQGAAVSSSGDLPEDPRIQPKQVSYRACIVGGLFTAEPPGKFCRVTQACRQKEYDFMFRHKPEIFN